MPVDPSIAAAAINAGGQAANNVLAVGTGFFNRMLARKDYQRVRNDNLAYWHMQNEYNSPAAQMQRLKDAGLNPHLVYGNGATATSNQGVNQGKLEHVAVEPPQFDPGSVMGSYFDASMKQAQTDNLRVQKTVMEQEAILKAVQSLNTLANTTKTKEETTNIQMLRESTIEAAKKNVEKIAADIASTEANTQYTLSENMRKQEIHPITIRTMNEAIQNMKEQRTLSQNQRQEIQHRIQNMVKEGVLKDWEIKLSEQGIRPGDPLWIRKFYDLLESIDGKEGKIFGVPFKAKVKPPAKDLQQLLDRLSPY